MLVFFLRGSDKKRTRSLSYQHCQVLGRLITIQIPPRCAVSILIPLVQCPSCCYIRVNVALDESPHIINVTICDMRSIALLKVGPWTMTRGYTVKVLPVHLCSLTSASVSKGGYSQDMFFYCPLTFRHRQEVKSQDSYSDSDNDQGVAFVQKEK